MVALPRREVIEKNIVHLCSPETLLVLETGQTDNVDKSLGNCLEPKWTFSQVQITQRAILHLPFKLFLPYVPSSLRKTSETSATACKVFSPNADHHLLPLDNFSAVVSFQLCVGKGQGWEAAPVNLIEANYSGFLPLWELFFSFTHIPHISRHMLAANTK